jgi:hypothetical protein
VQEETYHPDHLDPPERHAPAGLEPAWRAAQALRAVESDELREVVSHPAFRPPPDRAWVPMDPCPICGAGALRTAGTVRLSLGLLLVRACDACGLVDLDPRLDPGM